MKNLMEIFPTFVLSTELYPQINEVQALWNDLAKCFKICHICGIEKHPCIYFYFSFRVTLYHRVNLKKNYLAKSHFSFNSGPIGEKKCFLAPTKLI